MVFQYSREAVRRLHRQFADAPLYTELPVGGAYSDLGIVPAARTPGHRLVDGPVARFRHRAALRRNGDAADDRRVCRHRRVRPGTDCRRSIYLDIHCRDIRGAGIQGIRLRAALPIRPLGVSARGTIDGTGVRIVASLPRARPGIGTDGLRDYGTGQHFFQLALCRMELQPLGRNLAAYSDEPALDSVPRKYERRRRRHRGQRFAALHHNPGNRPDCCIQAETGTTLPNTDQYINYQQDTKCEKST